MSINNKRSYTEYTVTQPTTDFAIGFDDFDEGSKDNILVTLNGVLVESLGYAAIRKNESTVTITPAITEGTVRLTRETDIDEPFHKFTAGALFSAKSMDENFQQVRHSQQEVRDGFEYLEFNTSGIVSAAKSATNRANDAADEVIGLTAAVNSRVDAVEVSQEATIQRVDNFIATDVVPIVNDAINNTAVEGGVLADTFVTATANRVGTVARTQRDKNSDSITVFDFGAISDGGYHPLSERYATLAEAQEQYPHALALTDSIDWCAAQAFLNACHETQYANADMTMDAAINRTLTYKTQRFHATQVIGGDVVLEAVPNYPMDFFVIWQGAYTQHTGSFTFKGVYSGPEVSLNRTVKNGILLGSETIDNNGANGALGAKISSVVAYKLSGYAFIFGQSAHFAEVGYTHAERCGSIGLYGADNTTRSTWSDKVDVSRRGLGGYSRIKVETLPAKQTTFMEAQVAEEKLVIINEEIYAVKAVDYTNKTIDVRPAITTSAIAGDLAYIYGGGVMTVGNDTANTVVGRMNAILCGVGFKAYALWGTSIPSFTSEYCGAGVVTSSYGSISMSSTITNGYFEANAFDTLELWTQDYASLVITNSMGLEPSKMFNLFTLSPDADLPRWSFAGYSESTAQVKIGNRNYSSEANREGYNLTDSTQIKNIFSDNPTITINTDEDLRRLYTKECMIYCFHGGNASGNPQGIITINAGTGSVITGGAAQMTIDGSEYDRPVLVSVNRSGNRLFIGIITAKKPVPPEAAKATSGVTANRPLGVPAGYQYFDTTLGKPVYYKADGVWVDATGATA